MSNLVPGGARDPGGSTSPAEPGALFGREPELLRLSELLARDDVRLVTLTGPGGIGKTSLATELARRVEDPTAPSVFVPLAEARTTEAALGEIATALDLDESGDRPELDEIAEYAANHGGLIVLDNLEQLPEIGATLAHLLDRVPGLVVLATSRSPIGIRAEHLAPVSPLATTPEGPSRTNASTRHAPAIALFIERAQRVQPALSTTDDSIAIVAEICRLLDGMPLAIELAAARCRLLPLPEMLERLRSGRLLLDGGALDLPERQRTMDRTVAWSYELLSEGAQRAFRVLSVFDGFVVGQAELGGVDERDLTLLLDASLVVDASDGAASRFRMLEPIRQVGLRMLADQGELDDARAAQAAWFVAEAPAIDRDLQGAAPAERLGELDTERGNLASALDWLATERSPEALALFAASWRYWYHRSRYRDGLALANRLLDGRIPGDERHLAMISNAQGAFLYELGFDQKAAESYKRAEAIWSSLGDRRGMASAANNRAMIELNRGNYQDAEVLFERSATLFGEVDDPLRQAQVWDNLGMLHRYRGDTDAAIAAHGRAAAQLQQLGSDRGYARALHNLATAVADSGDLDRARQLYESSRAIKAAEGDIGGEAVALASLGYIAARSGEFADSSRLYEQALEINRSTGYEEGVALNLHNLGSNAIQAGDPRAAFPWLRESLSIRARRDDPRDLMYSLAVWADLAIATRQPEIAVQLYAAASAQEARTGVEPGLSPDDLAAAREEIGASSFQRQWEKGRQMTAAEAVSLTYLVAPVSGQGDRAALVPAPTAPLLPFGQTLTKRELDVLRLVATGKSNAQIGDALFISPLTAKTHVANLLGKIGVENRAAAATWAAQHNLLDDLA